MIGDSPLSSQHYRTYSMEQIIDGPEFREYAAGLAEHCRMRLNNLDENEKRFFAQFDADPLKACDLLRDRFALDQVTARLKK